MEAALACSFVRCIGIDTDMDQLAVCATNVQHAAVGDQVELIHADATCLPLANGSVDAIVMDLPFGHSTSFTVPHSLCLTHCASLTVPHLLCLTYSALLTVPHPLCLTYSASPTLPQSLCLTHCASLTVPHPLYLTHSVSSTAFQVRSTAASKGSTHKCWLRHAGCCTQIQAASPF